MNKIIISSIITSILIFSGCSKTPVTDEKKSETKEKKQDENVETEEVLTDDSTLLEGNGLITTDSEMLRTQKKMKTVYFDYDKFTIRADMQDNVSIGAKVANTDASKFMLKLEGNCDEWGSDEYNFALGLRRANSVKKALIAEGVESNRITMVSYGESNPTCNDNTQNCWSKNRRVDFKLLP